MIDLHCHMLPGIDDGAPDLETSLEMARVAVADGITITACTPHITPGVYDNTGPDILERIAALQAELDREGIDLQLTCGADAHVMPAMVEGLRSKQIPSLGGSRYFLFEPPHHVAPPRLEDLAFELLTAGYIPVLTHPERLTWIEDHYDVMVRLVRAGVWMQITCGSVTGRFGQRPRFWAERMLDEGLVHILATDAHNLRNRKPKMAEARDVVAVRLGESAANDMVETRPRGILDDVLPTDMPDLVGAPARPRSQRGFFGRMFNTA